MRGPYIGRQTVGETERFTVQFSRLYSDQLRSLAAARGMGVAPLIRDLVIKELESINGAAAQPQSPAVKPNQK